MNQQILSQDEVDALMQGIADDGEPAEHVEPPRSDVRPYDMAGDGRIVRPRMPALEVVGERFARNLRGGVFDLIRKHPEIAVGGVKVQKYSAFIREIVVPTSFNIVSMKPLHGAGLVVCDPNLVFAIIDSLFGGAGKYQTRIEGREFSATEQRVIARLLGSVCAAYNQAWQDIYPLTLAVERTEMQPQFVNIATGADMVVTTTFTLEIGESSGALHFCFPYATLEPIRDVLYNTSQGTTQGDNAEPDKRWIKLLTREIQAAEVELVAELATTRATVEQLLSFKAGDFVELDLDPAIQAKVDGVPVFDCTYGTANNRYAIKIDRLISSAGTGWLGDTHVS
jgi:flagellar motor switch protein FliM